MAKQYLSVCCSCDEPFMPEYEPGWRVCIECGKKMCEECAITNPPEWKGLCFFCAPHEPEEDRRDPHSGDDPQYWNRLNEEKKKYREFIEKRRVEQKLKRAKRGQSGVCD